MICLSAFSAKASPEEFLAGLDWGLLVRSWALQCFVFLNFFFASITGVASFSPGLRFHPARPSEAI